MKAQRLAAVLIVGAVLVGTGAGVLLYTGGSDIGSDSQADGANSTGGDVTALNQSADGMVYLDVAPSSDRNRTDLEHALVGLYDEKSINVSSIEFVDSQRDASTVALATDGRSNAPHIATWIERHLDQQANNADAGSSNHSEAASSHARCGVEPAYYQLDFVAGEPIENLQGPEGTYTPDELIRFAHGNSERSDIRRSSNGEFTTNDSLRNAVDSKSISVENGTATVSFSIAEDSDPVELTLASYTKPQQVWTRATESEQEFVDADTRTFKPGGSYTLSVEIPNSKVVPCETDTEPEQPDPSTETDTSESPGTTTPDTTTPRTTTPGTTDEPPTTTPTTTPPTETPPAADLSVTKTVDDANATVGDNVTFTVEITNNGPDAASNVTVNEMLGSGLAFQSGEVSQGVYDPGTGVYSVGTLANGETATLGITATIKSVDNTTNAVEVTSDQPDPNSPNNNDSATPSPATADLSLTKNVNESAPNVGENVAYTLTLTNDGPNATSNVTVADALPDGVSYVSSDASQGEYNNGTGLWTVDSLSDGSEATLTIVATADTPDDVTNVAEVNSSDTFDPDSTPNNDDPDEDDRGSTTTDGQSSDLAVTKTVNDSNVTVGDSVEFTVEVTNNGPDAATNVSVDEMLGDGLSFRSASTTQGSYDTTTNVYDVGTLENGETATLTLTATIEGPTDTTNTVEVTSETPDPNDPNNNDSVDPTPSVADLALDKSVNESTPNVGENVEYTLTLSNDGPNATSNVTVADALPDGLSFVSSAAGQGSYDNASGLWTVGDIASGDEITLSVVATVESTDDVTNVAEINSSDTFDPNSTPNNNESDEDDQDSSTVNGQSADLAVTKTADATDATVGDNVTFTVDVTNNGPDTATNVSVNESLGSGFAFQNATTTQGSYDANTSVYTVGTLDSNETATLTLTATIDSVDNTTNAVEVTGEQPDPNPPNNNDSANPTPAVADLSLTKNVNESAPNVGDTVEYTLTLTNDGPNATSGVTVADALPDDVSYENESASQGSYDAGTNLWTVDNLADDGEATLSIVATVESTDDITNVAEVDSSDTFDPDSTPNNDDPDEDDRGSTTINGQSADLAVSKTVNDTDVTVGDNVTFTVEVTNNGPDTATNVAVDEMLGTGFEPQNTSVSQGSYDSDTNTYTVGTLASDETATLTITATIESPDDTANAVEVTSDTPDPNDPNNNDSVDPTPSVADLSLTKNVNESAPNVGDTVEYTLTLSNNGPNATSGVTVADELPDGLVDVSATASQGSYDTASGLWTVGTLGDGDQSTLTVTATVQSTADLRNIAEVNSSDTFDPNSTPNNGEPGEDDQDNVTVNGQSADLAVTKSVDDSGATVGDDVTFTVEVTNNGPNTARNVVVDETLPDGLTFVSASPSQGSYDESDSTYDVGDLASGETATLELTATIEDTTNLENVATATSDTPDPDDSNNEGSATPSPQVADLSLDKSVDESAPPTGGNVEFTLTVTNNGPDATSNVAVEDTLPDGLSFVEASGQGSYSADTGVWDVGDLAANDEATLTLTATVESSGEVTNTAEVTASDTFDPNSAPDNGEPGENDQDAVTLQPTAPTCNIQLDSVNAPDSVSQGDSAAIDAAVTNDGLEDGCGATATLEATGESTRAVDIVFLIDTSASTGPYIDQVANQLDSFASDLNDQNIDARYAVISYGGNDGYVDINQEYTSDSDQAISALNDLRSSGSIERNYRAIERALNDLNPRPTANNFLIDVTDEDTDRRSDDPTRTEIANQIDDAGASFIAVSPDETEVEDSSLGMKTLSEGVRNGHWVDLFVSGDGPNDPNPELSNFVEGFQDIVVDRVEEGINRDTSITLDGGESGTLSFTVETNSFQAGSELDYTVTVGGDTQTGTITITGSGSSPATTNAASVGESSATSNTTSQDTANETTTTPEMTASSSENASNTTTATQTPTTEPSTETATTETETATETPTDEPTETATTTGDTTTETPTTTGTETTTETTDTSTETTEPGTTAKNTTAETPETTTTVNTTAAASANTTNETSLSTANATSEAAETSTETENTTAAP